MEKHNINVKEFLNRNRIRPSVQRVAIMEYLLVNKNHPTVDQIYEELADSIPTLSKTTVYNTLTLFALRGIILVLTIDSRNLRFDGVTAPHAHFLCEACGELYDISISKDQKEAVTLLCGSDHEIFDTQINLKGICKNCKDRISY